MTRRVLAALLGLAIAVLAAVVLPLGLQTAAHYRTDYLDVTVGKAQAISSVAEEYLADHEAPASLGHTLHDLLARGDSAVLFDRQGVPVDRVGPVFTVPKALRVRALAGATAHADTGTQLLVAVPIGTDQRVGAVVLARSRQPLEARVRTLWLTLAAESIAALLAATLLGLWLSQWVARPLHRLEAVVGRVGAGDLAARVGTVPGPAQVRLLAASFDAMVARLNALIEGHRAVIADVSHQLRTPMLALRLRLELLQTRPARSDLTAALDELARLSRMVDGLLAVARAEADAHPPRETDLAPLLQERASAWQPLATERGVQLTITAPAGTRAWVVTDHLQQILDNLLGNCFDLEPAPSHIHLNLTHRDHRAVISVADDGPGMTADQRDHAFRRFATDHADTGGTGLGLAIVHRLVTAGHGDVTLRNSHGGGLTVEITLPQAP